MIRERYLNGLFNLFLRIGPFNALAHFDHNHVATTPIDKSAIISQVNMYTQLRKGCGPTQIATLETSPRIPHSVLVISPPVPLRLHSIGPVPFYSARSD